MPAIRESVSSNEVLLEDGTIAEVDVVIWMKWVRETAGTGVDGC
jgi:hypothetical protein